VLVNRPAFPIASVKELVDVDESTVVLEQLDFDLVCTVQLARVVLGMEMPVSQPCGRPASWLVACRTCERAAFCCDEHASFIRTNITACATCRVMAMGGLLYDFTPLVKK
jgi:hypothetical protein